MKNIKTIETGSRLHWVGDGFPVQTLFTYNNHGKELSPFLLLDMAGPHEFTATNSKRGVGQHPHRGFETVTIVFQGELTHADSTGQGGTIGPGDVQWMTAGRGILHEEYHSENFSKTGGVLQMAQLWVNLPASHKMTEPTYQAIDNDTIPFITLADDQGRLRVIAGNYQGKLGPAKTFTPMTVLDIELTSDTSVDLVMNEGWSTAIAVVEGAVTINDREKAHKAQTVIFDAEREQIRLTADTSSRLLVLSGEPINEPVVGYGPFVMNSSQQIEQAIDDINNDRFGSIG